PGFCDDVHLQRDKDFHRAIHKIELPQTYEICFESWTDMDVQARRQRCTRCATRRYTSPHQFGWENDMVPSATPPELLGLTMVEEALIAIVNPMIKVYRLPYQGVGYSGHVISFPKDVDAHTEFATELPRIPEDVDVLV